MAFTPYSHITQRKVKYAPTNQKGPRNGALLIST